MSEVLVKRIETIYLPVSNPNKSAEWYVKHLGLKLLAPVEQHSTQAQLGLASNQSLFLIQTKDKTNANFIEVNGNEQCVLTFEVSNFEHLYKELKESGVNVTAIEDNADCGMNFYVYDLDRNKLDIWSGWPSNRANSQLTDTTLSV